MKAIHIKEILHRIRKTKVTFFSIAFIISLGVSTYLGIIFSQLSMEKTGDNYFKDVKFHNIEISSKTGLTQDDIEDIKGLEHIDKVEGGYVTTGFLSLSKEKRLVTVQSVTYDVDKATVIEGRLPEKENEIAIEKVMKDEDHLKVGDTITVDCSEKDNTQSLLHKEFKIVGVVTHPAYTCNYVYSRRGISNKGNGNCLNYLLVAGNAFDQNVFNNRFTNLYVWSDMLSNYNCFSKNYKDKCDSLVTNINNMSDKKNKENWSVKSRNANVSYAMYDVSADGFGKLSFSFAFVYIVVALMVCYSSIGRVVGEQRQRIGIQKALGYRKKEIMRQYIIYSMLCTILGSLTGVYVGIYAIERLSVKSYVKIFIFDQYDIVCSPIRVIIVVCLTLIFTTIATILACNKLIQEPAVKLLKHEIPNKDKQYFFEKRRFWNKVNIINKTVIKSIFNDKRHMLTTIIGVVGCTALLIIGFTLKFSIDSVNKIQFNDIQRFDISMTIHNNGNGNIKKYQDYLEDKKEISYIEIMDNLVGIRLNGKDLITGDLLCSSQKDMNDYFYLKEVNKDKEMLIPSWGVLLSSNTGEFFGINKYDYIDFMGKDGQYVSVQVVGFVNNYVGHFIVMSPKYYEEVTGESVSNNTYFMKLNGINKDKIEKDLKDTEGFVSIQGKEMGINIFKSISDSLKSVVQILILLSGIMALIVLLNLSIMHINDKARSLIIMRINGFTLKETKKFIKVSDIILTTCGLIIGVLVGIIIGSNIVKVIGNDNVCFVRTPSLTACLIGVSVSTVFSFIVNKLASRRIKHFPLTNLNDID